jgi:hypothetical protein
MINIEDHKSMVDHFFKLLIILRSYFHSEVELVFMGSILGNIGLDWLILIWAHIVNGKEHSPCSMRNKTHRWMSICIRYSE